MNYSYTAKDLNTGKTVTGHLEAPNDSSVLEILKKRLLLPIKVKKVSEENTGRTKKARKKAVGTKDIVFFTRQMAQTLKAGILLTEALEVVGSDIKNKYFSEVILAIRRDINAGSDFTSALRKYDHIFSDMYIFIVQAGETSGTLNKALMDLAVYLEESHEVRERIKTGLTYPCFLICFTFLIIFAVVVLFIPKFEKVFTDAGQDLPWLTQAVTSSSKFLLNHLLSIGLGIAGLIAAFVLLLRLPRFNDLIHRAVIRIPLIGTEILHKAIIARFCRTFGIMLEGGIVMTSALTTLTEAFHNKEFVRAIKEIKAGVVGGKALSAEIERHKNLFPALVSKMVYIGEKTGRLEEMLIHTAYYYEEQVKQSIKRLIVLIEPVMIIIAGIFISIIVLAIYLPIFNMISVVQF